MHRVWLGPASIHLADKLNQYPDIHQLKSSIRFFPDGESCIKLEEDITNEDVVIIQNTSPPQDENLRHLFQMVDVLKFNRARTITCIVPYLAYSRQDRRTHPGEPFSLEIVVKILELLGVNTLVTFELHNSNVNVETHIEIINISTDDLFVDWIRGIREEQPILICPDKGSQKRIEKIAQILDIPFLALHKYKNLSGETWYENEVEVEGATAIIIDDLCSSGSTLIPLCHHLKRNGVSRIRYGVTHFFADSSYIREKVDTDFSVYCTDTIPSKESSVSIESLIYTFITLERRSIS
ncbi:ribose-phosphate diphosphokinase [Paenibacillus sp. QZ-Y1]|uniref:ribose-phosphate diphosphokinase n=1 Tax=Paenibacillus sp. QZ-Y1 TaxID=3414511 RepID=UPI003F7A307B